MDMLCDEQDSFEQQQCLFRPVELMYCRNLVALLTEEFDQVRQCLGHSQRANRVLVAERYVLTAEVQRHRLRYVQFLHEENQRHGARGGRLSPDDRDAPSRVLSVISCGSSLCTPSCIYRHFPASGVAQVRQLQRLLSAGFSLLKIRGFPDCMRLIEDAQACPGTSATRR